MVSGTTQVVAVIGHPIAQVKSPDNFNRYFAEQHMDSVMIPVDIVPDAVAAYLNALRGWQNMTGVLVTVPHKQRAAALVDDLTPRARRLNAVNVIRKLADGRLQALVRRVVILPIVGQHGLIEGVETRTGDFHAVDRRQHLIRVFRHRRRRFFDCCRRIRRGGDPSAGPARSNPGHPAAPA